MGRRCICYATKEVGNTDEFYKLGDHYYKTKEIAEEYVAETIARKQVFDIVAILTDYVFGRRLPPLANKKLTELHEEYSWQMILETLLRCQFYIAKGLKVNDFVSEYRRFSYLIAILRNHIVDIVKDYESNHISIKEMARLEYDPAFDDSDIDNLGQTNTDGNMDRSRGGLWNL